MSPQPCRPVRATIASLLSILLMIQATGCTSWPALAQPWPVSVAEHPNQRVQITLRDGRLIQVDSVAARTDTLVLYHAGRSGTLALSEVTRVQVREVSELETAGLLLALTLIAVGVVWFGRAMEDFCTLDC